MSDFLKDAKINQKISELTGAQLTINYKAASIMIWIDLKFASSEEQRVPLIIQTDTPKLACT